MALPSPERFDKLKSATADHLKTAGIVVGIAGGLVTVGSKLLPALSGTSWGWPVFACGLLLAILAGGFVIWFGRALAALQLASNRTQTEAYERGVREERERKPTREDIREELRLMTNGLEAMKTTNYDQTVKFNDDMRKANEFSKSAIQQQEDICRAALAKKDEEIKELKNTIKCDREGHERDIAERLERFREAQLQQSAKHQKELKVELDAAEQKRKREVDQAQRELESEKARLNNQFKEAKERLVSHLKHAQGVHSTGQARIKSMWDYKRGQENVNETLQLWEDVRLAFEKPPA